MQDSVSPQPNGPTSWRDVYALVQDSERRLTQTIVDGFKRTNDVTADHEVRLRVIEQNTQHVATTLVEQNKQGEALVAEFFAWRKDITKDVEGIKDSELMKQARMGGIMAVGTKAKAALVIGVGIVGPLITTILLRVILPPQ
jgi:hypothetical protein